MNLLKDSFLGIQNIGGNISEYIALKIHLITGLEDLHLLIFVSTSVIIFPIAYILINNFTKTTSAFKLSLLILVFANLVVSERNRLNVPFLEILEKQSHIAGAISILGTLFFSIMSIAMDPYYQGLFGRFKDD